MSDSTNVNLALLKQVADGFFSRIIPITSEKYFIPAGVNGPYFDLETPVRNTAHWLIIYSILFKLEQDAKYLDLATGLLNYLLDAGKNEQKNIFIQRQKQGKDWSNGVIGQAWVLEALVIAADILNRKDAEVKAHRVSESLKFSVKIGAWNRPKLHGYNAQVDYTLNHQLWFAAAKAELFKQDTQPDIEQFLNALDQGAFQIRNDGRICHLFYSSSAKGLSLRSKYRLSEVRKPHVLNEKEIGYHLYNLHPLARLRQYYSHHPFFNNEKLHKALAYAESDPFIEALEDNHYSYPYNSPAFEFPLVAKCFQDLFHADLLDLQKRLFDNQKRLTFDERIYLFSKRTDDPLVLTSRIYELLLSKI